MKGLQVFMDKFHTRYIMCLHVWCLPATNNKLECLYRHALIQERFNHVI